MTENFNDCSKGRLTGDVVDSLTNKVQFRRLDTGWKASAATVLVALANVLVDVVFVYWLFAMAHEVPEELADILVIGTFSTVAYWLALGMECFRLVNIISMSLAVVVARVPVCMKPYAGMRVALFITFVPSKEDIVVLEKTLRAAKRIHHRYKMAKDGGRIGCFDIFVLDENNDPASHGAVQEMVEWLNDDDPSGNVIYYFSRYGVDEYNQQSGQFAAKTKYGNINACFDWVDWNFGGYDVLMGIDPDHVPVREFGDRMLGYFRDRLVAFVVGPQAYANATSNYIARWAESQQFVFHSLIQPAANTYGAPMLVGTSYAIRWDVLKRTGGIQPSITEDMLTTFTLLSASHPKTGRPYKSVYTPDVLAHGEGPGTWGDYFSQQARWSRGTLEIFFGPFWTQVLKLVRRPLRLMHYVLLMTFYPSMAVIWIFGSVNALIYALFGASAVIVDPLYWLAFYGWAAFAQAGIYLRARKHNVSPYEEEESWGVAGMLMSVLASPIFAGELIKTVLRRPAKFVVTPKGAKSSGDSLFTFRFHLVWGLIYISITALCVRNGYATPGALAWPVMGTLISFAPIMIWGFTPARDYACDSVGIDTDVAHVPSVSERSA